MLSSNPGPKRRIKTMILTAKEIGVVEIMTINVEVPSRSMKLIPVENNRTSCLIILWHPILETHLGYPIQRKTQSPSARFLFLHLIQKQTPALRKKQVNYYRTATTQSKTTKNKMPCMMYSSSQSHKPPRTTNHPPALVQVAKTTNQTRKTNKMKDSDPNIKISPGEPKSALVAPH